METHSPCEVVLVKWGLRDVRVVFILVIERTRATEGWREDVGVFKGDIAEDGCGQVISKFEHILNLFF